MKHTFLLISCCLGSAIALFFDADLDQKWKDFMKVYDRQYDPVEEIQRRVVWEKMMHFIVIHNREAAQGLHSYTVDQNQFSDMTSEEFNAQVNGFNDSQSVGKDVCQLYWPPKDMKPENLNASVDWRLHGYVTDIKNQGLCGGCYAFSATGTLEGQHAKATGKLVSLSEQNIMDCSFSQGDHGCDGGNMDLAFKYVIENRGVDTEKAYPRGTDKCNFKADHIGATMTSCKNIFRGSENDLTIAVAQEGPVSVALDAGHKGFQSYKAGIYDDPECTHKLNHGVLAVGYGSKGGNDYWIIKNSWGPLWGEDGYIRMSRNKNMCGIAEKSSFPVV